MAAWIDDHSLEAFDYSQRKQAFKVALKQALKELIK